MCKAISELHDSFGMCRTIDADAMEAQLEEMYRLASWRKLGFNAYVGLFADAVEGPARTDAPAVDECEPPARFRDFLHHHRSAFHSHSHLYVVRCTSTLVIRPLGTLQ